MYYNKDSGYFEHVHSHGMVYWDGKVTPSSSFSTLYLPEEAIGAVSQLVHSNNQDMHVLAVHSLAKMQNAELCRPFLLSLLIFPTILLVLGQGAELAMGD